MIKQCNEKANLNLKGNCIEIFKGDICEKNVILFEILIFRDFKEEKSIDTQDNQNGNSSGTSSVDGDTVSTNIKRRNSKYSFNTETGRKNILILCLLVVCLVSNFNEQRGHLGKKNILTTDLDKILFENKMKLMKEFEENDNDINLGINEINSEYLDITATPISHKRRPNSIVKMNGLVPFVAKSLSFDRNQEDTLYELCMKYANINMEKTCQCPEPEQIESFKVDQRKKIGRFSRFIDENNGGLEKVNPEIKTITLSKHVSNTKALEPYKSLHSIIEEDSIKEISIFDFESKNEKNIQIEENDGESSSLDNFKEIRRKISFKLPEKSKNFVSPFSPFSKFLKNKKIKKKRKEVKYTCRLHEEEKESKVNQFNLILGKSSCDKLKPQGTYSTTDFRTF